MPGTTRLVKVSTANGSDLRQLEIEYNNAVTDLKRLAFGGSLDLLLSWQTLAANSLQGLGRGSTDTSIASGGLTMVIGGVPAAKAAVTTGTAPGTGTIGASKWGILALDIVAAGTITVTAGADNATGYATEALAIAALPPRVTAKARMGYVTVLATAGGWTGQTDAFAGGSSGAPATTTNYYPVDGVCAPTGVAYGPNGVVTCGGASVISANGTSVATGTGTAWTGGRNGMLISAGLALSSNDLKVANLACTFNCNGATNIAKAAVTTGTTIDSGGVGTTPAGQWAILVLMIDGAGTITYLPGPANYTTGYKNENAALADLYKIFPTFTATTGKAMLGYVTVQAQAANAWIAGTDAFAGGTTGNEAQATNYYSVAGITIPTGQTSALLATSAGTILTQANL